MKNILNKTKTIILAIVLSFVVNSCIYIEIKEDEGKYKERKKIEKEEKVIKKRLTLQEKINNIKKEFNSKNFSFTIPANTKVDSVVTDNLNKIITLYLSKEFSYQAFREDNVKKIKSELSNYFNENNEGYSIVVKSMKIDIDELIPNFYRVDQSKIDKKRMPDKKKSLNVPLIQNISKPYKVEQGLNNKNIVLWHSHGWYYANEIKLWQWQRPRLFQTVEDYIPMSFTLPYIVPMLENAGANVFIPRERDLQKNEIIIDNDDKNDIKNKYYIEESKLSKKAFLVGEKRGFGKFNNVLKDKENPFQMGTTRYMYSDRTTTSIVSWIPEFKESGTYGVYVSYSASDKNVKDAKYTVYHLGGKTEFLVNQQVGGGTFHFLGFFSFAAGYNKDYGKVTLENISSEKGKIVSIDAVRFGGGFGVVEREGLKSGRPKYAEGARYYLQFLGMPDTLVYNLKNGKNDYVDDYQCRNEYANYLNGAPNGPNRDLNNKGLGIPIDLSLAFHTDAGITRNDTVVGTLSIYSIEDYRGKQEFPDGMSRLANRDLADILQTEIVNTIRAKYDDKWTRRQLMNADYAESVRPNIPSVLLELLSHQNFLDMKFMLDPEFRFDVSRAIYKAFLKFITFQNGEEYCVQPLPVKHFMTDFDKDGNIVLRWKPQEDYSEPTAKPEKYIVYTRLNDGGFDNGFVVEKPEAVIKNPKEGVIYSFKVTALNKGGESFPSEILSVYKAKNNKKTFLIVNGFDRVSGPATIETPDFSGFFNRIDPGVPYKFDFNFVGEQWDYNPASEFITNNLPGHGASSSDYETKIIAGNTFDFVFVHGKALANAGYSFVSASDECLEEKLININKYEFIDFIFGNERETKWQKKYGDKINGSKFIIFTKPMQEVITNYLYNGGNVLISGSYIGSELFNKKDSNDINFATKVLNIKYGSSYASGDGKVIPFNNEFKNLKQIKFNTEYNDKFYLVHSPEELLPTEESKTILIYSENQFSAAVGYRAKYGVVCLGFPFETIINSDERNDLMKNILSFLKIK